MVLRNIEKIDAIYYHVVARIGATTSGYGTYFLNESGIEQNTPIGVLSSLFIRLVSAGNEIRIVNFWSSRSLIICTILFGLKLKIKKKIIKYQPQNFAKKSDICSIILKFIRATQEMEFLYDN